MATGSGTGNRVLPTSSRLASASDWRNVRATERSFGWSGNRAVSRSPRRKIAFTVPSERTGSTNKLVHLGNWSATSARTVSTDTVSWPGCIDCGTVASLTSSLPRAEVTHQGDEGPFARHQTLED